jgi:hypothetical protein
LRDSAKITFGSLVIGALLPSGETNFSLGAFWGGLTLTFVFLVSVMYLARYYAEVKEI